MNLDSIDLLSLQTSYLQQDKTVQAICKVLNPYFQLLSDNVKHVLIYSRIDELDGKAIDELAWQFHVDFYDSSLTLEKKRKLVKNSIWWHKIKGTPQAVEEVVTSIFGNTDLKEWFEYDGAPYYFSLNIDVIDQVLTKENLRKVFQLINKYKNTRSWLESLKLHLHAKSEGNTYIGSTLVSTKHYILTSDFNMSYDSNLNQNLAATMINTTKYTLTNDINVEDEGISEINQASNQSISLCYELY